MAKFRDMVVGLEVGKSLYCPAPLNLPDPGQVRMKLVTHNDHGLMAFEVYMCGVRIGDLYGKPGGELSGWRFDPSE